MTRAFAVFALLLVLAGTAHAFGLGLGNRFGKLGAANGGGGIVPVSCSNKLDFSQSCNSQYLL